MVRRGPRKSGQYRINVKVRLISALTKSANEGHLDDILGGYAHDEGTIRRLAEEIAMSFNDIGYNVTKLPS